MDHNHGGPDDVEMLCPMQMSFHGGSCEVILFPSWATTEVAQFVGAWFGFFLLALLYEGLKFSREILRTKELQTLASSGTRNMRYHLTSKLHVIQSVLHLIQVSVSYVLMLIVMTFNLWLCLAVVSGAAVGYYFFGWFRQSTLDPNECCN
ncbi:high affinity copper uptake protein 1-like [Malaya genurostris]|uniref:high affinity copper uptake protein 1-like n=1 Tax=Malaya genurostris TaxID=325434 RepID=UPI0026F3A647|nr:high affinity copper uptake protein 1-like [Malaya genurostris]XP_058444378.1 high affinity copper uptake protein 1-like [Malaya genurostris]